MKSEFICLDNGGKTFDRYTIIERATGEMVGSSEMPFNPLGFGQYCGNVVDNYWLAAYGTGWRYGCSTRLLNKRIKFAIDNFLADCENVGKQIPFDTLPDDVQKYVKQVFSPEFQPM